MRSSRRTIWSWIVLAAVLVLAGGLLAMRTLRHKEGPVPLAVPAETNERLIAYRQLCEAKELAAEERYGEAAALFEKIAREQAGTTYGWDAEIRAAAAQGHLGKHQPALDRLQRAVRECPEEELVPVARIAIAEIHSLAGNPELGVRLLEELIREYADRSSEVCAQALFTMTGIHGRAGQFGLVRGDLLRIVDDFPGNENNLGNAAQRQLASLNEGVSQEQRESADPWGDAAKTRRIDKPLAGDSRWEAGHYLVMHPVELPAGARLRIAPGAEVRFGNSGGLKIAGRLEVEGTPEAPVRLGPLSGDAARDWWMGLTLAGSGSIVLRNCHLIGADIALRADEGGEAVLDHCTIHRPTRRSVRVSRGSHVRLSDCDVLGSQGAGIECGPAGRIEVERCRIRQAAGNGLVYRDSAPGCVLRDSLVEGSGNHGLLLQTSNTAGGAGEPRIDRCIVRASRAHGVRCIGGASPAIRSSEISGNGGIGVWFEERWNAALEDSRIVHNRGGGVLAESRSAGTIQRNLIADNGAFGLQLRLDCTPVVAGNAFLRNKTVGLWLREASVPQQLENNIFAENGEAALRNESASTVKAGKNWWGSAQEAAIQRVIEDHRKNSAWGPVEHAGFLTAPPARPVATSPTE
jgi:predicted negative regulator of RcsB-dependent stress response